jgi:xylulokinase
MALLGIDVGTTGVKTLLIGEDGAVRAEATRPYPLHTPAPGWFEQDPEDWWTATAAAIRQALKDGGVSSRDVKGIGLSGMYHGLVMLDRQGRVLRRSILWNDQRTARQSAFIIEKVGQERLRRICATGGAPYFTACKLQWVRDTEPAIYDRAARIMLPKDYVRFRLTGECCTDVTDASGTLFLDVAKRRWSDEIPALLDVPRALLPELVESAAVSGQVNAAGRADTGLELGTPVAGGGGDQACAAVGMGIVREGAASYSIGTSGVIYAATGVPKTDAEGRFDTFCHAVPGTWCVLACINAAAGSHQWYQDKIAAFERAEAERRGTTIYAVLEELAARAPLGSGKLLFLPYLAGERHPHTDTEARGVWFGLHAGHGREHLIRSVLEGVAFAFRDCLEAMKSNGIPMREIRATGGGARSPLWLEIIADATGHDIVTMKADSGGASFGAALLGGVAAGAYRDVEQACAATVATGKPMRCDAARAAEYGRLFEVYRGLYPALRESYRRLADS